MLAVQIYLNKLVDYTNNLFTGLLHQLVCSIIIFDNKRFYFINKTSYLWEAMSNTLSPKST